MSDDANPYRAPAFVEEYDRDAALHRSKLRKVAFLRRALAATAAIHVLSLVLVPIALARHLQDADASELDKTFSLASMPAQATYLGIVFFGVMLVPIACPSFGKWKTLSLLLPIANVVIAFLAAAEANRTLKSAGVRVGWLFSDYSGVAFEGAKNEPRTR